MGEHRSVRFTQADLKRAVKGAEEAGMRVGCVRIDPNGRIEILAVGSIPKNNDSGWDDL